jgi:hypothetical protein
MLLGTTTVAVSEQVVKPKATVHSHLVFRPRRPILRDRRSLVTRGGRWCSKPDRYPRPGRQGAQRPPGCLLPRAHPRQPRRRGPGRLTTGANSVTAPLYRRIHVNHRRHIMSDLTMRGLSPGNLDHMRRFAAAWPDREVSLRLVGKVPWSHNQTLLDRLDTRDLRDGTPVRPSSSAGLAPYWSIRSRPAYIYGSAGRPSGR